MAWTDRETAELRGLFREGKTHQRIAAALPGRSRKAVSCRCENLGLRRREEKNWTERESLQLLSLRLKGKRLREIAARLGRTAQACKNKLARLAREPGRKERRDEQK